MYKSFFKRITDILYSLVALILLVPLILLVALILFAINHGNPFFIQTGFGKNGKPFNIIKFKTMNEKRDKEGSLLLDKDRLTIIGNIIRKTSIDELPQLLNVIKGDCSLVGLRPLLIEYLPLYDKEQARRHKVKPGITGWVQVNGRNNISQ